MKEQEIIKEIRDMGDVMSRQQNDLKEALFNHLKSFEMSIFRHQRYYEKEQNKRLDTLSDRVNGIETEVKTCIVRIESIPKRKILMPRWLMAVNVVAVCMVAVVIILSFK